MFLATKWLTNGYPPDACTYHQFKTFSELINQHIIILSRKQESHYEAQADLEILFFWLDLGSADITRIYHHIQPYKHGHGLINRKEIGRKGRNKAKRTIRSLVDVFLHAFSTWHLPRIGFSCFCVNKINYLDESFRVLLSVAGSLNDIQNLRAFLSFTTIINNKTRPRWINSLLFSSIINYYLHLSRHESFMDFANQIQFPSKSNSCTAVGIQW